MFDDATGGERRDEDVRLASETLFDTEAFKQFDRSIDASLAQLVARFWQYATPRATRSSGPKFRRGISQLSEDASPDTL